LLLTSLRKKSPTSKREGAPAPVKVGDEFQVIDDAISDYAKDMFVRLGENYNISLVEWNHDIDHVHILFKAHPNSELSKFINAYKSASSRLIKKHFPQVKRKLWKEYFWSRSFCLLTTGGAPIEVIKKYIENQGMK
jgi:putative transposase